MPLSTDLPTGTIAGATGHAGGHNTTNTRVNAIATEVNAHGTRLDGIDGASPLTGAFLVDSPGDGSTVTTAFQAAVDAAAAAGPGATVLFGAGVHGVAGLVMKTGVHLRGPGHSAATLRLPNGANTDVIVTEDFADHTGDDADTGGPTSFSLSGFSIDGNTANNTAGNGVRIYGRDFILRDLRIYSCDDDGVYTEWSSVSDLGGVTDATECLIDNVKSHDNGGWGFNIQGPHDGFAQHCVAYTNALGGFKFHNNAHGFLARSCHAWGVQPVPVTIQQNGVRWELGDAETTGSAVSCLIVAASDCIVSGKVWDPGNTTGMIGVQLGDATTAALNCTVDAMVMGTPGGAVNFHDSDGSNRITLNTYLSTGSVITGTPHVTDVIDIATPLGVAPDWEGVGGGGQVRDWTGANYTHARRMLPDPAGSVTWTKLGRWTATASGSRIAWEVNGTSGYSADQSSVGRTFVVAALGDGQSPNIAGYYYAEGGAPAVIGLKAVATAGATGRQWDVWAQVSTYIGNCHITAELGNDTNPATWVWDLTTGSDPGAASSTIVEFTSGQVINSISHKFGGHIFAGMPSGYVPILAAGAGAGSGPTATVVDMADAAGTFTILTGSGPSAGILAQIVFAVNYPPSGPKAIVVTPQSAAAQALGAYVTGKTEWLFQVGTVATPTAATSYTFSYAVIG